MSTTLPVDSPSGIEDPKSAAPPAPQADDVFEFPATLGEKRFWLLDQLQPGNPAFNMPLAFDLSGRLDAAALETSLREIVRRHEILRTTFAPVDGEVRQIVAAAGEPGWSTADLSHVPEAGRGADVDGEVLEEARRPFSLERGPLIRGRLLRLAPDEHVLLVTMHHIVCDGWSNGVLVRELGALYEAYSTGKPSSLPDLPIQYADYAIWQKEWLEGQRFDDSLAWWREKLAGPLADVAVPADRARRLGRASAGVIASRLLPPELSRALKALSRREDSTLFMAFLAGFQSLLFRYTGTKDVILCSPSANRHPPETEALIGSFAHPLILRTDLSGDPTFREVLLRVRDGALGAFNHQAIPFERLVEELARSGAAGASYMPRIMFIYQTAFMQPLELPGLSFKPRRSVSPGSQFEIVLSVVERAEGHRLQLEYNPDLHDADTIATLLSHLETLLTAAAARPETPVAALPLWTEAELTALREKSETPADDPRRQARTGAAASPVAEASATAQAVLRAPGAAPRVEPCNEVEARLRRIWEKVLGVDPIGVEDDYFELGGHSLIAVQLMGEIERSFGRRLPLATLVQAPTIGQMALLLGESQPETPESWPSLVPIQTAGSKPPLFCVHAVGGNVLNYIDLSRHLGPDQPVYGLQAKGLDGRSLPHTRVEDMAAHYIEQIRHVQRHGPYSMGGTSAGGLVVFEMAQQLAAAGERVAVLALFDAWAPGYPRRVPGITPLQVGWNRLRTRVDLHVSNLVAAEGVREKTAYLFRKALRARRAAYVAGRRYWHRVRDPIRGFVDATPRTLREVESATRKASDVYVPRPYAGKLTLFRATKQPAGIYPDPHLGWGDLATGGIAVYDVPGHHGAIVYEPRVGALAVQLEKCLAAAREAPEESGAAAAAGRSS